MLQVSKHKQEQRHTGEKQSIIKNPFYVFSDLYFQAQYCLHCLLSTSDFTMYNLTFLPSHYSTVAVILKIKSTNIWFCCLGMAYFVTVCSLTLCVTPSSKIIVKEYRGSYRLRVERTLQKWLGPCQEWKVHVLCMAVMFQSCHILYYDCMWNKNVQILWYITS